MITGDAQSVERRLKRIMLALSGAAIVMTGCYRYVPAQIEATPPGTDVEIIVTRRAASQAEDVGALQNGEPRLRGTVERVEGDDLLLRVPLAQRQEGFIVNRIDQALRFPLGDIVNVRRRELNGLATGLLIGGGVAVIGALVAVIADPLKGENVGPEPPPDDFLLSVPISLPFGR